ncbi:hypothetical protein QWY77_09420 [Thalassotalea ponticola]|uniref:hypothetical protein n=1 Tax=Thalassotalea ponticola TaxID=1523392 RepID=UPI0025B5B204|nr:hypothetical protein [Thalassotalea ponticola]MDN3652976.1 hypothetical protein [Thalassotalea ponticola]
MIIKRLIVGLMIVAGSVFGGCSSGYTNDTGKQMNPLAERYVKLALEVGKHHDYYIDAYYGPKEWQQQASKRPLTELAEDAQSLLSAIERVSPDREQQLRKDMLQVQVRSLLAFVEQLGGKQLSFDQESLALYDAVSGALTEADFDDALAELDQLLPGQGDLNTRLDAFQRQFVIPSDKLAQVFDAAISEARNRTKQYIELPSNESFTLEYVTSKPWSGYNWYQGNSHSVIQVNTDFDMQIDRAIDLASHEGYPGHHVFNSLMEKHLVNGKGWIEYSKYPLYSPLSLLAEGSANYGIEVAFPQPQRLEFERDVLFKLAELDASQAERYYQVQSVLSKLSYAGNVAAKRYLDGQINKQQAIEFLMKYALSDRNKSAQRIDFIERYRAYVINYNLGQDIVRAYVEPQADGDHDKRWQVFSQLLANPKSASMMQTRAGD